MSGEGSACARTCDPRGARIISPPAAPASRRVSAISALLCPIPQRPRPARSLQAGIEIVSSADRAPRCARFWRLAACKRTAASGPARRDPVPSMLRVNALLRSLDLYPFWRRTPGQGFQPQSALSGQKKKKKQINKEKKQSRVGYAQATVTLAVKYEKMAAWQTLAAPTAGGCWPSSPI